MKSPGNQITEPAPRPRGFGMDEPVPAEQARAIRAMPLEQRLAAGMGLIRSVRRLKRAALRQQHPEWTDAEIANEMRRLTSHGRT